ncbi:MAG: hypothetical protein A2284_11240 [Deltaproteobacteria bacterium RIFOXYA12_FULL_61_11]|nr:MAG: hypothetical protein A2284_11240 [Deltaproteobacteria bacterium RIFOXYA12_FULL_61_11]
MLLGGGILVTLLVTSLSCGCSDPALVQKQEQETLPFGDPGLPSDQGLPMSQPLPQPLPGQDTGGAPLAPTDPAAPTSAALPGASASGEGSPLDPGGGPTGSPLPWKETAAALALAPAFEVVYRLTLEPDLGLVLPSDGTVVYREKADKALTSFGTTLGVVSQHDLGSDERYCVLAQTLNYVHCMKAEDLSANLKMYQALGLFAPPYNLRTWMERIRAGLLFVPAGQQQVEGVQVTCHEAAPDQLPEEIQTLRVCLDDGHQVPFLLELRHASWTMTLTAISHDTVVEDDELRSLDQYDPQELNVLLGR